MNADTTFKKEVKMEQTTSTTHNSAEGLNQGVASKDMVSAVA